MTVLKSVIQHTRQHVRHFTARPRPSTDIYSAFINDTKTVNIIGAPLAKGQPLLGVDRGPTVIRKGGLVKRLEKDHWRVNDTGDLDFTQIQADHVDQQEMQKALAQKVLNPYVVSTANKMIFEATRKSHETGDFTLTLGGDHSIAIGTLSGALAARNNVGIVWVDAHGDINTPLTSGSGNIHGMVISFLMNHCNVRNDVPYFGWMNGAVPTFDPRNNLVYVGLRDVDEGEKQIMKHFGIKAYTMYELDKFGVAKVMEMALDHVLNRVQRPIHLSFDIDSVDPTFAPSTGTRVAGGLTYREAYYICESLAETGQMCSMDLAEVNPLLNEMGANATVDMANGLIASALGNTIM